MAQPVFSLISWLQELMRADDALNDSCSWLVRFSLEPPGVIESFLPSFS